MSAFSDLALSRRSIRKFQDCDIPINEIEECIKIAVSAPSGCNSQCWKFVAIKDKRVIAQIAAAVVEKVEELLLVKREELSEEYLASKRKIVSFFTKAPVVVAVFMTKMEYYDPIFISALYQQGLDDEAIIKLFANPDLLSIGAAIQNLLLAVHEKGYGACWMNEPAVVGAEINRILKVAAEHKFISLIPIGVPAYLPQEKKMKDLMEVFSSI